MSSNSVPEEGVKAVTRNGRVLVIGFGSGPFTWRCERCGEVSRGSFAFDVEAAVAAGFHDGQCPKPSIASNTQS